uniref:Nitroreductase domain-containing protein n=1 Tax=Eiseniibacteriota bacterium TaxID=2212470 RepID=A0A832IC64_UNCEI
MEPASHGRWPPDRAALTRPRALDRRRFLAVAAGAAAYAGLRPALAWAKRAPEPVALQPWALPADPGSAPLDVARALIGAAVLAPSDWNAQPWRFEVEERSIRIVADPRRALSVTDPDRRGMMLSLGAALENLLVAGRAWGLRPAVTYLPHEGANGVVAEVGWTNGEPRRDRALFGAITARRTNRRDYDGRGLYPQNRAQLLAQVPDEVALHWVDDRDRRHRVADVLYEATHAQVSDRRAQAERFGWLRFDGHERRLGDGVAVDALEFSGPADWFAGSYFDPKSFFLRFGADSAAKQARAQVRSAGALALLTTRGRDDARRLRAGQTLERLLLTATSLGIAQHAMGAAIEVERFRGPLLEAFGAGGEDPLLLVRLGHARAPKPSPRRAVSLVATWRTT